MTYLFIPLLVVFVLYNVFSIWESRKPREIRLLWGKALSAVAAVVVAFLFYGRDPEIPLWAYATVIFLWSGLTWTAFSQLFRQITMTPSLYGAALSDRDYHKALKIATRESLRESLSPAPEGRDLTGR